MPLLRPAIDTDQGWLYELHERAHRSLVEAAYGPWVEQQQRQFFQHTFDDYDTYVIHDSAGDTVGGLYLGTVESDRWIELIEIDPARQGKGLGSAVLTELTDTARLEGFALRLQVHRINLDARRLYERSGFRLVDETPTHFILRFVP